MNKDKAKEQEEIERREALKKQGELLKQEETQMEALQKNADLAQMYIDNAKVGSENLGGETPLLKVHQTGKSNSNELADSTEPNDGWFFYKPTGEQFESLETHILTISRGFRAPGLNEDAEKLTFNQLMGGVIVEGKDYKPFIIYMTGKKLQPMWDFGKAANKYTHAKPIPIPMFALTVDLSTTKEANSYGKSWLINMEIRRNPDGTPVLVGDMGEFQFLKGVVEDLETMIASIIEAKTKRQPVERADAIEGEEAYSSPADADEIPF